MRRAGGATVLVTLYTYTRIGVEVLEQLPDVRLVATRTAGYSHIDVTAAARLGIAVAAVPDAPTTAVTEYTLRALLMVLDSPRRLRDPGGGAWDFTAFRGGDLAGQTLGVIGLYASGAASPSSGVLSACARSPGRAGASRCWASGTPSSISCWAPMLSP